MGKGRIVGALACAWLLAAAAPAAAEVTSVFEPAVSCQTEDDGTRFCGDGESLVPTFDGQLLDVNVALPPVRESGADGPYPLVMVFHGYGGSKLGLGTLRRWTRQGYAAFSMTDRGFGPCGAKPVPARCLDGGWVRLMDTRYEVRDAQHLAGLLVDQGVADPGAIAATGGSYGGGLSMALAALKDRIMLPDGSYAPWTSPAGTPLSLAAAAPEIPWTDLAYALMPNGRTLDYVADAPYLGPAGDASVGVMKLSFVTGLLASGLVAGHYALPLVDDPDADLVTWFGLVTAGEPYDQNPLTAQILDEVTAHHSSYYIDHSVEPAPLLISNGWTDDVFPADEAIRFYNRTRTEHPDADISLFFLDYGHQRGQGKDADEALLRAHQNEFFAHHLAGGAAPPGGVTALTQTCPGSAPSGGPYTASEWSKIAPGEVRRQSQAAQTILPVVPTDVAAGLAFDPIAGPGACARTDGADQLGAATYRLPPAPEGGYTLMGAPTVIADFTAPSQAAQVAARLLDVAPDGQETLVARGLWRPETGLGAVREVFQLHPNGYRFAAGHVAKLELLPADIPYSRVTNLQPPVIVENLDLRLPVLEEPGSGAVGEPQPKVVPDGYELAAGFEENWEPEPESPPEPEPADARCRGKRATIVGSRGPDRLIGTDRRDVIVARRGADMIHGKGGNDLICAGRGADRIFGGPGRDRIWTGAGRDAVRGGPGRDVVDGKRE